MKKLFILLIFCLFISSCEFHTDCNTTNIDTISVNPTKIKEQESAQNYYNNYMHHIRIKNEEGHDIILHESGVRGFRNYAFSIEHAIDCQKCYDLYD